MYFKSTKKNNACTLIEKQEKKGKKACTLIYNNKNKYLLFTSDQNDDNNIHLYCSQNIYLYSILLQKDKLN